MLYVHTQHRMLWFFSKLLVLQITHLVIKMYCVEYFLMLAQTSQKTVRRIIALCCLSGIKSMVLRSKTMQFTKTVSLLMLFLYILHYIIRIVLQQNLSPNQLPNILEI